MNRARLKRQKSSLEAKVDDVLAAIRTMSEWQAAIQRSLPPATSEGNTTMAASERALNHVLHALFRKQDRIMRRLSIINLKGSIIMSALSDLQEKFAALKTEIGESNATMEKAVTKMGENVAKIADLTQKLVDATAGQDPAISAIASEMATETVNLNTRQEALEAALADAPTGEPPVEEQPA